MIIVITSGLEGLIALAWQIFSMKQFEREDKS
jgi:hypothetical protein